MEIRDLHLGGHGQRTAGLSAEIDLVRGLELEGIGLVELQADDLGVVAGEEQAAGIAAGGGIGHHPLCRLRAGDDQGDLRRGLVRTLGGAHGDDLRQGLGGGRGGGFSQELVQLAGVEVDGILGAWLQVAEYDLIRSGVAGIAVAVGVDAVPAQVGVGGAELIGHGDGIGGAVDDLHLFHGDQVPVGVEIVEGSPQQGQHQEGDQQGDPDPLFAFAGLRLSDGLLVGLDVRGFLRRFLLAQHVVDRGKDVVNGFRLRFRGRFFRRRLWFRFFFGQFLRVLWRFRLGLGLRFYFLCIRFRRVLRLFGLRRFDRLGFVLLELRCGLLRLGRRFRGLRFLLVFLAQRRHQELIGDLVALHVQRQRLLELGRGAVALLRLQAAGHGDDLRQLVVCVHRRGQGPGLLPLGRRLLRRRLFILKGQMVAVEDVEQEHAQGIDVR